MTNQSDNSPQPEQKVIPPVNPQVTVVQPAQKKSFNQPLKKQIIFVFVIASLGVFAAFGTFFIMNQFSAQDLSQVEETLAWRPTITGSCQTGNIKLGPESREFDVVMTVTKSGQSQTLNFSSGADKELDEEFQWPFSVTNGDVINWSVKVTWDGNEENHTGQITVSGCATSTPSASPVSYQDPDYPACPANTQRLTVSGEVANSSSQRTKSHTLTVSGAGQITSISGVKKEGHPEEGCLAGTNNDNGKYPCDQGQLNEGFTIKVNGSVYGTVNDEGPGKDDQWFNFAITKNATLNSGNNTILVEHIGGSGIGSVDYKTSICYTVGSQATASPTSTVTPTPTITPTATPSPTASPTASPGVGGPVTTPSPTSSPTPTRTPTPAPTTVSQATIPPAPGGDGQSDGLGCAENDCSGNQANQVEQNKAVADAGTTNTTNTTTTTASTLPDAGVPNGIIMVVLGATFISLGIALGRKRSILKE
jgi:hypothetical protein